MKMKNHSNYFHRVFANENNFQKHHGQRLEKIAKNSFHLGHQKLFQVSSGINKATFLNKQDCLDNILAETSSMNNSYSSFEKEDRKLSLNFPKQKTNYKRINLDSNEDQSLQKKSKEESKQYRNQSYSITRKKRKLGQAILIFITQKIKKHSDLFGLHKPQLLHPRENYPDQWILESKQIKTQKLVFWTEATLTRIIEEFYSFILNVKKHQVDNLYKKIGQGNSTIELCNLFKRYFVKKFKTEKLCRQNFINLVYSLFHHLHRTHKVMESIPDLEKQKMMSKKNYWEMFEKILNLQIEFQDVFFYLYSRYLFDNIFEHNSKVNLKANQNKDTINQFFKTLFQKDKYLCQEFQNKFLQQFDSGKTVIKQTFLWLLLNQFKVHQREMKMKKQQNQRKKKIGIYKSQKILKQLNSNHKFWSIAPSKIIIDQSIEKVFQNSLQYQCKRLLSILCPDIEKDIKQTVERCVKFKILRMLQTVSEMSKQKWFEQLHYQMNQVKLSDQIRDLEEIEALQKLFKEIRRKSGTKVVDEEQISQFVKKLLTPRIFLQKLEDLVQNINSFTTH